MKRSFPEHETGRHLYKHIQTEQKVFFFLLFFLWTECRESSFMNWICLVWFNLICAFSEWWKRFRIIEGSLLLKKPWKVSLTSSIKMPANALVWCSSVFPQICQSSVCQFDTICSSLSFLSLVQIINLHFCFSCWFFSSSFPQQCLHRYRSYKGTSSVAIAASCMHKLNKAFY